MILTRKMNRRKKYNVQENVVKRRCGERGMWYVINDNYWLMCVFYNNFNFECFGSCDGSVFILDLGCFGLSDGSDFILDLG